MKSSSRGFLWVGAVFLGLPMCFASLLANGGPSTPAVFEVAVDNDNLTSTGCDVTFEDASGSSVGSGFERLFRITVSRSAAAVTVVSTELSDCDPMTGLFGAPTPIAGGWPVGLNNGIGGADVVEAEIPGGLIGNINFQAKAGTAFSRSVRLAVQARTPAGGADALRMAANGGPLVFPPFGPEPIPTLSEWGAILMALLLVAAGLWLMRRRQSPAARIVLMLAMVGLGVVTLWAGSMIVLDGQVGDWAGETALGTDALGDAALGDPAADIAAVFVSQGSLFFRIDVRDLEQDPPVAVDDMANTDEDVAVSIPVLANDSDPDVVDTLTVVGVTQGANGVVTIDPGNQSVTYTPNTNTNGTDTFGYTVSDNTGLTAVADVTVVVGAVNDPPMAADDMASVNEDEPFVDIDVLANDSDVEGPLTVIGFTQGANGTVTDQGGGVLRYVPAADFFGMDTFTYTVQNGGADTDTATVNITVNPVNDVPVFSVGPDQSVNQNDPAQTVSNWATGISPGPANEAGQTVAFLVTNDNNSLFSAQPAVDSAGTLTYTPAAGQNGVATVTVRAMDDGGTANGGVDTSPPQTFDISVIFVNQEPSFTPGADPTVLEDAGPQTVAGWATNLDPGAPDESGQTLTFIVTGNTNPGLFSASPAVSGVSGDLTFTPAANANGSADVTVVLMDNGGTANGGDDTSPPATFTINVTAVNDEPSFTKGADQTVLEDAGAQTVMNWATSISPGPPDESGQTVTFNITGNTNMGLFAVAPAVSSTGTLTYTPAANTGGTATITLELMDNGGTANGGDDTSPPQTFDITVTGVNDAPSFTKGSDQTVLEDAGPQTVNMWATAISPGPPDEAGQTVSFNITGNTNPGLFSAGPAVSSAGALTYTPAADASGSATITLVAMDNGGTANGGVDTSPPQMFVINVTAVNDPPTLDAIGNQTVCVNAPAQMVGLSGIGSGAANESQTLTVSAVSDNTALVPNPLVTYTSPNATGTLQYSPVAGMTGTAMITVTVDDGGAVNNTTSENFMVTVLPAPVAADDGSMMTPFDTTNTNTPLMRAAPGVLANDTAPSASINPLTATSAACTANPGDCTAPNVSLAVDGSFTYTPPTGFSGADTFTYTLLNNGVPAMGAGDCADSATVFLQVGTAPTAVDDTFAGGVLGNVRRSSAGLLNVLGNDMGDSLVLDNFGFDGDMGGTIAGMEIGVTENGGQVTGLMNMMGAFTGEFLYNPPPGFEGTDRFDYQISNGLGMDLGRVSVTVADMVWFIDNSAMSAGDGRLTNPFDTLAAFEAANGGGGAADPAAGECIFLHSGSSNYTGGVTLLNSQILVGQGASGMTTLAAICGLVPPMGSDTLPALGGARPRIEDAASTGISLAADNTVRGLDVGNTPNGSAIAGMAVGGLNVSEVALDEGTGATRTGGAVSLVGGGVVNVSFDRVESLSAPGEGIVASSLSGASQFSVAGTTTVSSPGADGIDLASSGGATFTFTGNVAVTTAAAGARGVVVNGAGTVNVNGAGSTVSSSNGPAVQAVSTALGMTFMSVSSTNSATNGVNLDSVSGSFVANGGSISGATGTALRVNAGAGTATYAGNITNSSGRSVEVTNRTGGAVTVSGSISDTGTGINVANNSGGTSAFSGGSKTLNTGANTAVTLSTNTGHAINFTGGGLDIDTSGGATGFSATGGGTFTVQGAGNSINTNNAGGNGVALSVANTNIGLAGLTFQSIRSVGGANVGISLSNTGTTAGVHGGLTVTGTGAAGTGGTIANKTGANGSTSAGIGIFLNQTRAVSLDRMMLNDFQNFAIRGTTVTNFTLANSTVTATAPAFNGNSAGDDEGSVSFDNLAGTASFSNSTIERGHEDNIVVTNTQMGSTLNMSVTGGTIGLNNLNDGILVESQNNAVLNLTVTGATFAGAAGDHIQCNALGTSTMGCTIRDNTFTNSHPSSLGAGVTISGGSMGSNITMTYDISGTTPNSQTFRGSVGSAVTVNPTNGAGSVTGVVRNNKIGVSGVANSGSSGGGAGIAAGCAGSLTHSSTIDNNDIDGINGTTGAIDLNTQNSCTLNATVINNTVNELNGFTFAALYTFSGGASAADTATICADVRNNSFDASAPFGFDVFIDQLSGSSASYNFPGYAGPMTPGASPNALDAFISGQNTLVQPLIDSGSAQNVTGVGTSCP